MVYLALVCALLVGMLWLWGRRSAREYERAKAERAAGTYAQRFVVVEHDGAVRELNFLEVKDLNREYDPQDLARPSFKRRHGSRNQAGTLRGYLDRTRVPAGMAIQPRESDDAARERAFRGTLEVYRKLGATLTETPEGNVIVSSGASGRFNMQDADGQPTTERIRCPVNWRTPDAP